MVRQGMRCQSSFLNSFFSSMASGPLSSAAWSEVSSIFVCSFSLDMIKRETRGESGGRHGDEDGGYMGDQRG